MLPVPLLNKLTIEQIKYRREEILEEAGQQYYRYGEQNTVRDVVDTEFIPMAGSVDKYGPARYVPILPGLSRTWEIHLRDDFDQVPLDGLKIKWTTYADNAPPTHGEIKAGDITVTDRSTEIR